MKCNAKLIFLLLLLIGQLSFGQINSLQKFHVETWFDNHMAVSTENETYLASELKYPQNNYKRGSYLIKLDSCNQILWKKIYQKSNVALNVHDLKIMENGDLLLIGGTDLKDIFLIRIDPDGNVVFSKIYSYSNQDFNYTIDSRNNQIMIFGNNFFTGGNPTLNYLLILDENGNIVWNKNYLNSVIAGQAYFCSDGGFLCHSGNILYKIDPVGNLEWAKQYPFIDPYLGALSNLVEGDFQSYYFTYFEMNAAHLVKIDANGNPDWIGQGTTAYGIPGQLLRVPDGFVWVNTRFDNAGRLVPILVQYGPTGNIVRQFELNHPQLGNVNHPEAIYLPKDNSVAVFASLDSDPYQDLYFRTSLQDGLCNLYEFSDVITPPAGGQANNVYFNPMPGGFAEIQLPGLNVSDLDFEIDLLCQDIAEAEMYQVDTLLDCGETYQFMSPFPSLDHRWSDGYVGVNRDIAQKGIYELQLTDCSTGIVFNLNIDKIPCACLTEFPSAFSPNADGLNDYFQVIGECDFLEYNLEIRDRWGKVMFESDDPLEQWDGICGGVPVAEEVYVFTCRYLPDNGIGTGRPQVISGELLLIR
ncbi:MAG: gliding motility-associated C-terminal domain-containing protein [Saprospiraceae bacterium]|nr:gliding motility-associated C-terminal domain-containing protein [Saprospiraceae bacterium]